MDERVAPLWRCLTVWCLATGSLGTLTALGLHETLALRAEAVPTFDEVVVALAGAAAVLVCPWLWLLTSWGVLDALRGRPTTVAAGWWRRATMAACGCAATVVVALPAHAHAQAPASGAPEPTAPHPSASTHVLDGLPYPERPALPAPARPGAARTSTTSAPQPAPTPGTAQTHLVRPGDTLWAIAAGRLHGTGAAPSPEEVAEAVTRLHHANREVVGDDPDLILPGQRLALNQIQTPTPHREDLP